MKTSIRRLFSAVPSLLLALGSFALLSVGPGCATTGEPVFKVVVKAQSEKQFLVDNRTVTLDQLPKALKRAGAGPATQIMVEMPAGTTPASMRYIYPTLQQAGFKEIFLTHGREVEATVKPLTPPAPATTKAPPPAQNLYRQ